MFWRSLHSCGNAATSKERKRQQACRASRPAHSQLRARTTCKGPPWLTGALGRRALPCAPDCRFPCGSSGAGKIPTRGGRQASVHAALLMWKEVVCCENACQHVCVPSCVCARGCCMPMRGSWATEPSVLEDREVGQGQQERRKRTNERSIRTSDC